MAGARGVRGAKVPAGLKKPRGGAGRAVVGLVEEPVLAVPKTGEVRELSGGTGGAGVDSSAMAGNIAELDAIRAEKAEIGRQLGDLGTAIDRETLNLFKLRLQLLEDRRRSAENALKLFNKRQLDSADVTTVRFVVEDLIAGENLEAEV